ncbi:TetR/AcrR family transcriptional regulator [Catenulispora pinisilvae]|uniref:TetR/AcrR family transcriptional regulator n=1 Tax=Catenulispora pinisilvae TaxID=2705253 RepID=UPI00189180E6|nr:TetR/AcrR family transcriptional regulator [Catenulispora pinisilvae]
MTMIRDGRRSDERHPGHVAGACADPACAAGPADGRRRPGRPRSEAAERAIVEAVLGLLSEGVPYGSLSMEQVATRAGVGKATVYRRWPNKESLVVDSVASLWQECPPPNLSDDRSTRDRILEYLDNMVEVMHNDLAGLVFSSVMAAGTLHPELLQNYHRVAIEPRREQLRVILRHGMAAGELRADLDVELTVRMISAPIVLTMKSEHPGEPLAQGFTRALVDALMAGIAAR